MAAVSRAEIPGARSARSRARSRPGGAALVATALTTAPTIAVATTSAKRLTRRLCTGARRRRTWSAVDRDRDGPATPLAGLRSGGEPEVDDLALDRVSDVRGEPRPVAGDVELRPERNELRVDGDDALADGNAECGATREVIRDRID